MYKIEMKKICLEDIFHQCLASFARDFVYGDAIRHLYRRGFSTERIMRDYDYPYTKEELEDIRKAVQEESRHSRIPD